MRDFLDQRDSSSWISSWLLLLLSNKLHFSLVYSQHTETPHHINNKLCGIWSFRKLTLKNKEDTHASHKIEKSYDSSVNLPSLLKETKQKATFVRDYFNLWFGGGVWRGAVPTGWSVYTTCFIVSSVNAFLSLTLQLITSSSFYPSPSSQRTFKSLSSLLTGGMLWYKNAHSINAHSLFLTNRYTIY